MSGFCAAWGLDGAAPDLEPTVSILERRGPDRTTVWNEGAIALGHTLLATTREALTEILPLRDEGSGCAITGDVRLDNRADLILALELDDGAAIIGDAELILRAYLSWGEECPARLLGDFAFAIWDPRVPRLFCARDHMGMRQLIYHLAPGRVAACANDAEALVASPSVAKRINEARIADYLDDLEGADFTSTFYEDVYRLPPAHWLSIEAEGSRSERYWELRQGAGAPESDDACLEQFIKDLEEAVRCRLRCAGPVGAMLSGGLDSSSVAAIAARQLLRDGGAPLRTYSAISAASEPCPETAAIHAVAGLPGSVPTIIDPEFITANGDDLRTLLEASGEPFDHHMTLIRAVYLAARDAGTKVVLDGVAGDVMLSSPDRVAGLLRRKCFRQAWREAIGEERYWKIPRYRFRSFATGIWQAFAPVALRRAKLSLQWRWADGRTGSKGKMNPALAKRTDLAGRRQKIRTRTAINERSDCARLVDQFTGPNLVAARERYDRVAGSLGVEPRDPFMDIRVAQTCLSLPPGLMQRDGWPKQILRLATEGLLPDDIRWRRGKEHLGWAYTRKMMAHTGAWRKGLDDNAAMLSAYVPPRGRQNTGREDDMERDLGLFALLAWLNRHGQ